MKFERYLEGLKGNRARHDNKKGKYHGGLCPRVDEIEVLKERERSR